MKGRPEHPPSFTRWLRSVRRTRVKLRLGASDAPRLQAVPDLHLEHAPDELPGSRSSRRSGLVLLSVLAVVALGLGAWWIVGAIRSEQPAPQGGTCIGFATAGSDQQCLQQAQDIARRTPLTDAQRVEAEAKMLDLDRVIHRVGLCLDARGNPCPGTTARRPATAVDAEAAEQRLKAAGFGEGSVVRVAREADPAPAGSLFYVAELPAGACVVGHITEVPGGAGGRAVVGKLPNGRCAEV
ncbi:hypothetical protein C8D88_12371 [Lentzea atacamensis]|uniref:Uncharacterized protein n=1 Tax=Lentzea atacamensis TaxID=531938 RepID=A0A316HK95_9PSEU|nr:hypothetical protein C8D88_12371 [Lentzea atacamensis]